MDNIFTLPNRSARDRNVMQREVRAGMIENGVSPQDADLVISRMSGLFVVLTGGFTLQIDVIEGFSTLGDFNNRFTCSLPSSLTDALIKERVRAELIYLLSNGCP
jgi:hypothetical protein